MPNPQCIVPKECVKTRVISLEADYQAVLKEISILVDLDPARGSPEGERLGVLATLAEAYEAKHFSIDLPDAKTRNRARVGLQCNTSL